jgi:hypothetical protein
VAEATVVSVADATVVSVADATVVSVVAAAVVSVASSSLLEQADATRANAMTRIARAIERLCLGVFKIVLLLLRSQVARRIDDHPSRTKVRDTAERSITVTQSPEHVDDQPEPPRA